jgi:glutamate-1-semialdehyde 2,1-aminomutase
MPTRAHTRGGVVSDGVPRCIAQIFKEAQDLLPGGVNSPVRAFRSVGGQPIVFDHVKGAYAWDVDSNKYVDYVGSWGPAIVGHANDEVIAALKEQIEKGTSFGAPCALEVRAPCLARL